MAEVFADVIIVPVHNRRETTLACLRHLAADGILTWATVVVVDDGSTDGTSEAVAREFPEVIQLRGDGTWWWAGSIRRGMEWALTHRASRLYWLNDDCIPPAGGLSLLAEIVRQNKGIAWINAHTPNGWSYGGHRKTAWRLRRCTPSEEIAGKIDTFSGNCVGLARTWIERVGLPHDSLFPHGIADLDYGLRLSRAGAPLQALPILTAANGDPSPESSESWLASQRTMREIWQDFHSPRSFLHFPAWRAFALRHWGPVWGWVVFGAPYARWCAIALLRTATPHLARKLARRRLS